MSIAATWNIIGIRMALDQVKTRIVLDAGAVQHAIERLADQALTSLQPDRLAVVGIQTGGVLVARRLLGELGRRGGWSPPFGVLDISLYRDDTAFARQQPEVRETRVPFKVSGAEILLVDDVIYTGRTVRAALDALIDFGRPRAIRLAVLVDRGLREYPIQPDFTGVRIETSAEELVTVEMGEVAGPSDRVLVTPRGT